jgi:hypothetical protein
MILVLYVLLTTVKPLMFHDFRFRRVVIAFHGGFMHSKIRSRGADLIKVIIKGPANQNHIISGHRFPKVQNEPKSYL